MKWRGEWDDVFYRRPWLATAILVAVSLAVLAVSFYVQEYVDGI